MKGLGIDESILVLAFDLIDVDGSGSVHTSEYLETTARLLHTPSSGDLLIIKRNLMSLCEESGLQCFDREEDHWLVERTHQVAELHHSVAVAPVKKGIGRGAILSQEDEDRLINRIEGRIEKAIAKAFSNPEPTLQL